jgi:hypothetical protein
LYLNTLSTGFLIFVLILKCFNMYFYLYLNNIGMYLQYLTTW